MSIMNTLKNVNVLHMMKFMSKLKKLIMMANQIDSSLPSEYMQLEYLESTGTQYIDTGFIPIDEAWAEIDAQGTSGGENMLLYAPNANVGSSTSRFQVNLYMTTQVYFRYGNSSTSKYVLNTNNKRHYYRIDHTNCYIDGINVLTHGNTASLNVFTKSITLFSATKTDGSLNLPFRGRVFGAKLGIGEMCSLNLIPALRKADSKPGMYDLVTGQFFINQGTGEFGYGYVDDVKNNN